LSDTETISRAADTWQGQGSLNTYSTTTKYCFFCSCVFLFPVTCQACQRLACPYSQTGTVGDQMCLKFAIKLVVYPCWATGIST
jgi:hypothetical protein